MAYSPHPGFNLEVLFPHPGFNLEMLFPHPGFKPGTSNCYCSKSLIFLTVLFLEIFIPEVYSGMLSGVAER